MSLEAIRYKAGKLEILDQLLLPNDTKYIPVKNTRDGWMVIKNMQVRGAPAIGVVGSLSLAAELFEKEFETKDELISTVKEKLDYLVTARPTAVNMKDCRDRLTALVEQMSKTSSKEEIKQRLLSVIEGLIDEDIAANKRLGDHGAEHILENCSPDSVRILTHCNTGSLATAGYGTALGVVRSLHARGKLAHCYCTETRPYNQGSRLTAYELTVDKIPSTLICDDMAAILMKKTPITAIALGADRIAAKGDTANKIGTYQLAVLAKYHGVPFYVVAPSTSVDLGMESGDEIVIEERPQLEMIKVKDVYLAPTDMNVWNPAFDVTPAELITGGIVTEFGVFAPCELKQKLTEALAKSRQHAL